jgi:hypothetical protein
MKPALASARGWSINVGPLSRELPRTCGLTFRKGPTRALPLIERPAVEVPNLTPLNRSQGVFPAQPDPSASIAAPTSSSVGTAGSSSGTSLGSYA